MLYNIMHIMKKYNRLFGVSMGFVPEVIDQWLARGARMIFAGNDAGYVHDGAADVLRGLHERVVARK